MTCFLCFLRLKFSPKSCVQYLFPNLIVGHFWRKIVQTSVSSERPINDWEDRECSSLPNNIHQPNLKSVHYLCIIDQTKLNPTHGMSIVDDSRLESQFRKKQRGKPNVASPHWGDRRGDSVASCMTSSYRSRLRMGQGYEYFHRYLPQAS